MAAKEDRIRGSINVPLTPKGEGEAQAVGKRFAASGGADTIVSSDLNRTLQTSAIIKQHNPKAQMFKTPALQPWHLGLYEGQPTKQVLPKIHKMLTQNPTVKAPGKGAKSTAPGESFNDYRQRFLPHLRAEIHDSVRKPGKKILTTHYRGVKLSQAWAKAGAKPDLSVDMPTMTSHDPTDAPGSIHYIDPEVFAGLKPGTPVVSPTEDLSRNGIYLVRHGETALNGES